MPALRPTFVAALVALAMAPAGSPAQAEPHLAVLHDFDLAAGEGSGSLAAVTADRSTAVVYGTTFFGGVRNVGDCNSNGCRTMFRLLPPIPPARGWTYQRLYAFDGGPDGENPVDVAPVIDAAGNLYGSALYGGVRPRGLGGGVVWRLSPPGTTGGIWLFGRTPSYVFAR